MDLFQQFGVVALSGDAEHYHVSMPDELGDRLKAVVPSAKRDRASGCWVVPATSWFTEALQSFSFDWSAPARKHSMIIHADEERRVALSCAEAADLELPGFGKPPRAFQNAGIQYALERERVIIGDEMGLGKTIQGLGTVYGADAYPLLVITPASLKYNWAENEIPACVPGRRVLLADKDTPELLLRMADIIVTNYEQLVGIRTYRTADGKIKRTSWADGTKKNVILSPLAEKLLQIGLRSIICDEAHYLKEGDTARTKAARAVRKGTKYRLLLTGTPMLNNASELASLLQYIDRLDEFGGWWHFMTFHCGMKKGKYGFEASKKHVPGNLNRMMRATCYVRRKKKDVEKQMPELQRGQVRVEIDNRDEYERAEKQLLAWVAERVRHNKQFMDRIAHLSPEEQEAAIAQRQIEKMASAERGQQMVRIQALKDVTARGKLAAAKEWIETFLESGEKLIVFATHKVIINQLLAWFPDACRIIAEDDPRVRQANVRLFQEDPKKRLIICAQGTSATNSPGGIGHTLTSASTVLTFELGWNNALHDQCEGRSHRIGQHRTVNSFYMLARNTLDLDIAELIESKRSLSAIVVDGAVDENESTILNELMHRLESRLAVDEMAIAA